MSNGKIIQIIILVLACVVFIAGVLFFTRLKKDRTFLAMFGVVCLALAAANSFVLPQIWALQPIKAFFLEGIFLLFALCLALKGEKLKRLLSIKLAAVFAAVLIVSQLALSVLNTLSALFAAGSPLVMVAADVVLRSAVVFLALLLLVKTASKDIKVLNKKTLLIFGFGAVLVLALRIVLFLTFEQTYYSGLSDLANAGNLYGALAAVTPPPAVGVIGDVMAFLIPTLFGASVYFGD